MATIETTYSTVEWTYDGQPMTATAVGIDQNFVHYKDGGDVVWVPTTVDETDDNGFLILQTETMVGCTSLYVNSQHWAYFFTGANPGPAPGRINSFVPARWSFRETIQSAELGDRNWTCAVQSGGIFAVSSDGYTSYSVDGKNWSEAQLNETLGNHNWISLVRGSSNYYILVGADGFVSRCNNSGYRPLTDVTWSTPEDLLGNNDWTCVGSSSAVLLAISRTGHISTSSDNGATWTTPTQNAELSQASQYWRSVYYGATKTSGWGAVSSDGYIAYSEDGTSWGTPAKELTEQYEWCVISYNYDSATIGVLSKDGHIAKTTRSRNPSGGLPIYIWSAWNIERAAGNGNWNTLLTINNGAELLEGQFLIGDGGTTALNKMDIDGSYPFARAIQEFVFDSKNYHRYAQGDKTDIYDIQYYCYRASGTYMLWADATSIDSVNTIVNLYSSIGRVNEKVGEITWQDLLVFGEYSTNNVGTISLPNGTTSGFSVTKTGSFDITDIEPATSEEDYGII